jgi:hypothetical protein
MNPSRFFGRTVEDTAELADRVGTMAHPLEGPEDLGRPRSFRSKLAATRGAKGSSAWA